MGWLDVPPPEKRRKRVLWALPISLLVLLVGWAIDVGFVVGLGVGGLAVALIALIFDSAARRSPRRQG